MESFSTIKRRTTDLFESAKQNSPTVPKVSMPSFQMPSVFSSSSPSSKQPKDNSMKGTWQRIDIPRLPRSGHSLDVVSGSAYVFGGVAGPRDAPVDNDMHVVTLPFSAAAADYFRIKAAPAVPDEEPTPAASAATPPRTASSERDLDEVPLEPDSEELDSQSPSEAAAPSSSSPPSKTKGKGKGKERATGPDLGDVPEPRVGHATAVIGSRILVFGGRAPDDPEAKPLEEAGRVWIFDTRTRTWTFHDPAPAIPGGSICLSPAPRSLHCAAATDRPRDFAPPASARKPSSSRTWQEWAVGDISRTGIPQDPIVGNVAEDAVDEESQGYGTLFVHGGVLAGGERTNDLWAFDVRSRSWTELPSAPEPARSAAAICISKSRLFRFGGFDGVNELGGRVDFLHLEVEAFDDRSVRGEISVRARGPWQSVIENNLDASSPEVPLEPAQAWPAPRSGASLEAITVGGGKEFLVVAFGESAPAAIDPEGATAAAASFHDDVWAFQVPPHGMSPASFTAAMWQAVGRKTGEGKWSRLTMGPYDEEEDEGAPAPRARLASAPMGDLEETGIVMLGGEGGSGRRLGDGWILRLE
jgi:hypothetical protein